jgi:hypothetical protein
MAFDANGNWVPDTPSSVNWFSPTSTYGTSQNPTMGVNWSTGMNVQPVNYGTGANTTPYNFNYTPSANLSQRQYGTINPLPPMPQYDGWGSSFIGEGKLFANGGDALKGVGAVLGGVGSLAQAWTAMKGLDFAKEAAATQEAQWNKNYEAQRTATNNAIANQNAWKLASGRTDTSAYVGDWSTAGNLTPTRTV